MSMVTIPSLLCTIRSAGLAAVEEDADCDAAGSVTLPAATIIIMTRLMLIIKCGLVKSFDDAHEAIGFQGSSTDQTAVYIGLREELLCVGGFAAASIED